MNPQRRWLPGLIIAAAWLSGCTATPHHESADAEPIDLRITPYPYNADRDGKDLPVEIGRFDAPAMRGSYDAGVVELGFLRYPAPDGVEGPPAILLTERPAGEALSPQAVYGSRESGDVIVLNRRGYGFSSPPQQCPGRINYPFDRPLQQEELNDLTCAYARRCLGALAAQDIVPSMFAENEIARDIEDLAAALKAERIRLLASDGTVREISPRAELARKVLLSAESSADARGADASSQVADQVMETFATALQRQPINVIVNSRSGRKIELLIGELDLAFLRFSVLLSDRAAGDALAIAVHHAAEGDLHPIGQLAMDMRQRLGQLPSIELLKLESTERCKSPRRETRGTLSPDEYARKWPASAVIEHLE